MNALKSMNEDADVKLFPIFHPGYRHIIVLQQEKDEEMIHKQLWKHHGQKI